MPIPESHVKERLSVAYLSMIAAHAGATCHEYGTQDYGTDAVISQVSLLADGSFVETGYLFRCQLKATTEFRYDAGDVVYEMKVAAYNKLVGQAGSTCFLILFCLPNKPAEWVTLDEEQLIVKRCCYWAHLTGPKSTNTASVTIRIPRTQIVTALSINDLLDKVARNEFQS